MKHNHLFRQVCDPPGPLELAAVHMAPGDMQLLQHGAVRGFRTGKVFLLLAGVFVAFVCLPPRLHAGIITFTAGGNESVISGGSVIVPITVTDFTGWSSAQFSLSWDAGVLQCVATANYNSQLFSSGTFTFSTNNTTGRLGFLWDSGSTQTLLNNPNTIFTVQFTAIGAVGTQTALSFVNDPTRILVSDGTTDFTPNVVPGGPITVVPEPINWALGLFACLFIGTGTVRWISRWSPMGRGSSPVP
jgi:hypothetical protein